MTSHSLHSGEGLRFEAEERMCVREGGEGEIERKEEYCLRVRERERERESELPTSEAHDTLLKSQKTSNKSEKKVTTMKNARTHAATMG